MTDIVLGIRLKADGSDLVGQVKVSEDALKKMREESGRNTGEAAKLNAEHKNLAATMGSSASETEKYVAKLRQEADTLGMTTLQIKAYRASKLELNDAQARGVAASLTSIKAHEDERASAEKTAAMITTAGKVLAAYAAAKVALTIVSVKSVLAEADDINKEAQALGVYAEWLSKVRYSGELANVSADQLRLGLRNLAQQMKEAENQTGNGGRIFAAMGIAVTDVTGRVRTLDNLLPELADRFQSYADGPRKIALALELFGRDGLRWIPLLNQGSEGLAKNAEEAQRLGLVIGGDLARKSEEFRDNITRLEGAFRGLKVELATGVLPMLSSLIEKMNEAYRLSGSFTGAVQMMANMNSREGTKDKLDMYNNFIAGGGASAGDIRMRDQLAKDYSYQQFKQRQEALALWKPGTRDETARFGALQDAPNIPKPGRAGGSGGDNFYASTMLGLENQIDKMSDGEITHFDRLQRAINAAEDAGKKFSEQQRINMLTAAGELDVWEREAQALKALREETERQIKQYDELARVEADRQATYTNMFMAMSEQAQGITDETRLIGLSTRARDLAVESMKLEKTYLAALAKVRDDDLETLEKVNAEYARARTALPGLVDARSAAKEAEAEQRKSIEELNSLWSTVESTGKTVFTSLFSHGKGAADGIGKAIKASVIDLLYQLTARKWIINIGASITGSMGISGAASAMGGGGSGGIGIGDLLSGANSIFGGGSSLTSNLFGGGWGTVGESGAGSFLAGAGWGSGGGVTGAAAADIALGLGADTAAAIGVGVGEASMAAAAGSAMATAIPYIGWAIAAYSLLSSGNGGTPAVLTSKDMPAGMVGYGAGLTGDVYGNDSNQGYRWVGEHAQNIWAEQINGLYDEIAKLSEQLGYDTSNIRNLTATVSSQIPAGSDYSAAFPGIMAQVSDQIARQLIPNLDKLAQAGESATQTLARLAMELRQAKLGEIFTLMGGAIALQDQTRDLWLSDLSPLTATERFNASNTKYAELLGKAPSDARAMAELGAFTRSNLSEAASYYGTSTPEYRALFEGRQADVGNLVTDTLTEQSIQFAEMGLTMKDIAANTKDLDTRIAATLQSAIDAWQAAQALIAQSNTTQIVTAVNSTAQQTAFVLASAASAEMNRGLAEDRASGDE